PKPIEGVATSTVAFLGPTERGPGRPFLVTNFNIYQRTFGSFYDGDNRMPFALKTFFDNGGRRCFVCRVASKTAARATVDLAGFRLTAVGAGAAYNRVQIRFDAGTTKGAGGATIGFKLTIWYWDKAYPNTPFDASPGSDPSLARPAVTEVFDD